MKNLHSESFTNEIGEGSLHPSTTTIFDQNERYVRSSQIGNEQIRTLTSEGIREEQKATFGEMVASSRNIQFAGLAMRALYLERSLEEARKRISAEEEALSKDYFLALELTRNRAEAIESAFEDALQRAQFAKISDMTSELESIYETISTAGGAWPIPQALEPSERNFLAEQFGRTEEAVYIEDVLPVEPKNNDHEDVNSIVEKAKKTFETHKITNPDLSEQVLFYLMHKMNETITVEELSAFCYSFAGSDGVKDSRSSITTTLGPKIEGKKKQAELKKHGLILQYGWRYAFKIFENGRLSFDSRTRIYRVVDEESHLESKQPTVGENYTIDDRWEPVVQIESEVEDAVSSTDAIVLVDGQSDHEYNFGDESIELDEGILHSSVVDAARKEFHRLVRRDGRQRRMLCAASPDARQRSIANNNASRANARKLSQVGTQ